ncbi:hypothetical protein JMUB7533_26540 [Staphylococcus aureus]
MSRGLGDVYKRQEYELVDEDDLMFALESEQITKKQFHEAYMIAHQIMAELEE